MPNEPTAQYPPTALVVTLEAIRLLKVLACVGGAVAIVYYGLTVPILATAGQETVLRVMYRAVVDMEAHVVLPYVAAGSFGWLWRRERRTRIAAVEREHRRILELEKQIDPDRTSSGLQELDRQTTPPGGA